MTQQSTKNYLISIAEHLLQQNCQNQAYVKYKRIKATLLKKQQKEMKLLEGQKSVHKLLRTKQNNQPNSNVKKRSLSTNNYSQTIIRPRQTLSPFVTNKKQNNQEKSTVKISKNKTDNFIVDGYKTIDLSQRLSKQKSNSKKKFSQFQVFTTGKISQTSILRKKKLFDNNNSEAQNLIHTKMKGLLSNDSKNKKFKEKVQKRIQNHLNQKITSQTQEDKKNSCKGSIHLNINLNKLLREIQASLIEKNSFKDKNNFHFKNQLILSQQNVKLLREINKKLNEFKRFQLSTQSLRLSQGFKKKKATKLQCQKETNNAVSHQQKQNQNLFSFVKISTPQKQNLHKQMNQQDLPLSQKNSNIKYISKTKIKEEQMQTQKKFFNINQLKMNHLIQQLKKDNKWLVQNVENLLNQNQQLKSIILCNR